MHNINATKEKFEKMLTSVRLRESSVSLNNNDKRNPFDSDYARVVVSSYFRRLQGKAQVFPLAENDFIRTRLTHSLEVSTFARGLGLGVEQKLIELGYLAEDKRGHLPSILAVAGLIHDIGNPPFGHSGETSIARSFIELNQNIEGFSIPERMDYEYFDGNVQGFRILSKLSLTDDDYSYNLTCPTLASVIKYPYSSVDGNQKNTKNVCQKKFGFFTTEQKRYEKIIELLGLNPGQRHPLTFLLEAADDIAYSVCDLEDGHRLKIISHHDITEAFKDDMELLKSLSDTKTTNKNLFVQNLRIKSQSKMLNDVIEAFIANFEDIVSGDFNQEIISVSKSAELRKIFKILGNINFNHSSVLAREVLGDRVINNLMTSFYTAIVRLKEKKGTKLDEKILSLVSDNIREKFAKDPESLSYYEAFQMVSDYISSMTDNYSLNLYRKLNGIKDI